MKPFFSALCISRNAPMLVTAPVTDLRARWNIFALRSWSALRCSVNSLIFTRAVSFAYSASLRRAASSSMMCGDFTTMATTSA